jgi:leader peptidase (prepilin peptidase)/N-methyltransferase
LIVTVEVCFKMSLTFQAVVIVMIVASPFFGRLAASFIRDTLTEEPLFAHRTRRPERSRLTGRTASPLVWLMTSEANGHFEEQLSLLYPGMASAFIAAALWATQVEPHDLIVPSILLGWALIMLFAYDVIAFILPDFLTYSLVLAGLGLAASRGYGALLESAAGALAGGVVLLAVKSCYRLMTGRDGLGMGDVKLFAAAGAWVGMERLPQILLMASLLGLAVAAFYVRRLRGIVMLQKIPFGAGLCIAFWITWMYGPLFPSY